MYKTLEVEVFGPFGSVYELKIDFVGKNAAYKKQDAMFVDVERYNVELSSEQLENFAVKLDEYNIMDWEEMYTDPNLAKGYRWEVRLVHNETQKQSSGVVAVPTEWDAMCKQISQLLGRRFA